MVQIHQGSIVILDLDDTLYSERSFQRSGFNAFLTELNLTALADAESLMRVNAHGEDVFDYLGLSENGKQRALEIYRNHIPQIELYEDAAEFISLARKNYCSIVISTEGRSITQRNKIASLGLSELVDLVLISEEVGNTKVDEDFYSALEVNPGIDVVMIGDNPIKDFLIPNKLGWQTLMLAERGNNVHDQHIEIETGYRASFTIKTFSEIAIK